MEYLSNDHEDHPNQHNNSHKQCNEIGHLIVNMMESQWKLRQVHDQNFPMHFPRESHCRRNTSIRRNKSIQKTRTVRVTVWDPSRKVNHLSEVIWDRILIAEFTRSISSTRIGEPVFMMDVKVSKDKHICRCAAWENLIYVRWNRIKNHAQRQRRWLIKEKKVRHWVK